MDKVRKTRIMSFSRDSAAKTSETVGAIAVIVGLLFVGVEIRENTVAQRFSATQTLVSEYNAAISSINDREFVCIFIRAGNDFTSLSQSDKIRYSILMQPIFRPERNDRGMFQEPSYFALFSSILRNFRLLRLLHTGHI